MHEGLTRDEATAWAQNKYPLMCDGLVQPREEWFNLFVCPKNPDGSSAGPCAPGPRAVQIINLMKQLSLWQN